MKKAFCYCVFALGLAALFLSKIKGSILLSDLSLLVCIGSMIFLILSERKKARTEYRTKGADHGIFNILGNLHLHIDGSLDERLIISILTYFARTGSFSKINYVQQFIAGLQRLLFPLVYESHTPTIEGSEALDFFSTTALKSRSDAITRINYLGCILKNKKGTIIEVEQVIGMVTAEGYKQIPETDYCPVILPTEVSVVPRPSLAYEIHHGFDIFRTSDELPISLDELLRFCNKAGISIGGWFVFNKGETWAYRSNSFSDGTGLTDQLLREYELLRSFLNQKKIEFKLRTMVERILGIWKIA